MNNTLRMLINGVKARSNHMRRIIPSVLAILILLSAANYLQPTSSADTTRKEKGIITFTKDVAPIFFKNCAECHRPGEAAAMSLLTYKDARPWAKSIREKVVNREMPPWHADQRHGEFKNERRLTEAEIDTIVNWVESGATEGDARDLPPAPKFVQGWSIGQPDLVLQMPEEYTLEATGPDEYQYFTIPTNFTEDRYVQAIEARPGNRRIIHHILAFIQTPSTPDYSKVSKEEADKLRAQNEQESIRYKDGFLRRVKADSPVHDDGCQLPNGGAGWTRDGSRREALMEVLAAYAPGREANIWEPGTVKRIPAGAEILLQVHYSKVAGSVQKDRSSVGLIFAKDQPSRLNTTEMIFNSYFKIPPGAGRHRATACWTTPEDIEVASLMPHMHMRGAAMEIKAIYPDGHTTVLLNVPRYDFSWQTNYSFKQPQTMPKGTRFHLTAYFDNSGKNRYNPDPNKAVRWGDPTYDEMAACFLEYTQKINKGQTITSNQPAQK
jgi:mono/diheme cytochrome c family protein